MIFLDETKLLQSPHQSGCLPCAADLYVPIYVAIRIPDAHAMRQSFTRALFDSKSSQDNLVIVQRINSMFEPCVHKAFNR